MGRNFDGTNSGMCPAEHNIRPSLKRPKLLIHPPHPRLLKRVPRGTAITAIQLTHWGVGYLKIAVSAGMNLIAIFMCKVLHTMGL
jgi:hypothetical protein